MKILQIIPELLVEDISKTINFYENILGFRTTIIFPKDSPVFAEIEKDGFSIMLYIRNEFEKEIPELKKVKMGGSTLLHIRSKNIENYYNKVNKNVNIIQEIYKTGYGTLEFTITDCNGYLIAFSEKIGE